MNNVLETSVWSVSRRVRALRAVIGIDRRQLRATLTAARGEPLHRQTAFQWENGLRRPSLDEAILLCDSFGVTLDWLYRGRYDGLPSVQAEALKAALDDVPETLGGAALSPRPLPRLQRKPLTWQGKQ